MKNIYILLDYKERFGSKQKDFPYRSGMDKKLITKYFIKYGYETTFLMYPDIDLRFRSFKNQLVLYQSSEDNNLHYKSYIEDILLGLQYLGAILIPDFYFFRAQHNKIFMEILRNVSSLETIKNIQSKYFGTLEDLKSKIDTINTPVVIKPSEGAKSSGVSLALSHKSILKSAKKLSKTKNLFQDIWDLGRIFKHKRYVRDSRNRKKIIIQDFVPDLHNDWKILIYGDKYYVLYRGNRKGDFRASGSGDFEFQTDLPSGFLDFAEEIYNSFSVPNLSLDIGYNGKEFFLFEFQAVYFGTTTIEKSPFYFKKINLKWEMVEDYSELEKVYVESIFQFINKIESQKQLT